MQPLLKLKTKPKGLSCELKFVHGQIRYLLVELTDILFLGPAGKQVGELQRFVSGPDQLHRRPLGPIFLGSILDGRLHGDAALGVPTDKSRSGGQVGVGCVVTNLGPPALPKPKAFPAGVEEEESWK